MSLEESVKEMIARLEQLAVELDELLSNPPVAGADLQKIGQEEALISNRLELLEIAIASAKDKAADIKRRLM